jgi:hypothetical protein
MNGVNASTFWMRLPTKRDDNIVVMIMMVMIAGIVVVVVAVAIAKFVTHNLLFRFILSRTSTTMGRWSLRSAEEYLFMIATGVFLFQRNGRSRWDNQRTSVVPSSWFC